MADYTLTVGSVVDLNSSALSSFDSLSGSTTDFSAYTNQTAQIGINSQWTNGSTSSYHWHFDTSCPYCTHWHSYPLIQSYPVEKVIYKYQVICPHIDHGELTPKRPCGTKMWAEVGQIVTCPKCKSKIRLTEEKEEDYTITVN